MANNLEFQAHSTLREDQRLSRRQFVARIQSSSHLLASGGRQSMIQHKEFDCVRMKWDIQQRLMKEFQEINPQSARQIERDRIAADPVLGTILQKVAFVHLTSIQSRT
jgi:hypothetical protein